MEKWESPKVEELSVNCTEYSGVVKNGYDNVYFDQTEKGITFQVSWNGEIQS